ncbi:MAG: hypothetical protein LBU18_02520 [Treponema sp.]|jgi:hypothetical protein|nr:hypothetical protein [Treponema sp.]
MIKTAAVDLGRMPAFAEDCKKHGITDIKYILKLEGGMYKDNGVFTLCLLRLPFRGNPFQ